jgi:hypothetical protein
MTPETIRGIPNWTHDHRDLELIIQAEIAAQLAELNLNLRNAFNLNDPRHCAFLKVDPMPAGKEKSKESDDQHLSKT